MESVSIRHALSRGAFHAFLGLAFAAALLLLPRLLVLAALATATVGLLIFEAARLRVPSLRRWFSAWFAPLLRKEEEDKLTGSSYFLIGCLLTAVTFPKDITCLAILFLSFGDPTATVVGIWKGRKKLWGRSVEGDIACLIVCILIGTLVAIILENPTLIVAIVGAIFATLFQALPLRLNDNLTIPLGSATAMMLASTLQSCLYH
jgi:glycerol-3-phosphate acyltransferase PlsY